MRNCACSATGCSSVSVVANINLITISHTTLDNPVLAVAIP